MSSGNNGPVDLPETDEEWDKVIAESQKQEELEQQMGEDPYVSGLTKPTEPNPSRMAASFSSHLASHGSYNTTALKDLVKTFNFNKVSFANFLEASTNFSTIHEKSYQTLYFFVGSNFI